MCWRVPPLLQHQNLFDVMTSDLIADTNNGFRDYTLYPLALNTSLCGIDACSNNYRTGLWVTSNSCPSPEEESRGSFIKR